MPTENRSTDMVSVPRELLTRATNNKNIEKERISIYRHEALFAIRGILAQPAEQHQVEPTAWYDPDHQDFLTAAGRAATLRMGDGDRLARYTVPLYAAPTAAEELDSVRHWRGKHAESVRELEAARQLKRDFDEWVDKSQWIRDGSHYTEWHMHPADVIKKRYDQLLAQLAELKEAFNESQEKVVKRGKLLAERDALLRRALNGGDDGLGPDIDAALSASVEPNAPAPMPAYMGAVCDKFDWTPEEALRFYAEGKHFDTDRGRTRILCTGAIASHALKGMSKEYADFIEAANPAVVLALLDEIESLKKQLAHVVEDRDALLGAGGHLL